MTKKANTRNYQQEPLDALETEITITALHATGEYSVLRKLNLERDSRFSLKSTQKSKIGLCIDTETTGLNHTDDKIIELGIVSFEYNSATAEIIRITDRYNGFEDPGCRLPKEIMEITGITAIKAGGLMFRNIWNKMSWSALPRRLTLAGIRNALLSAGLTLMPGFQRGSHSNE